MHPKRKLRELFIASITTLPLAMGLVAPAHAAEEIELAWNHPLDDSVLTANGVLSHLNGNVTLSQCSAPTNPPPHSLAVKDYVKSNPYFVAREIGNSANPRPYVCPHVGSVAVGKDGTLYTSAVNAGVSGAKLTAYNGSTVTWQISPLPHNCQDLHTVTIGANGNVYALVGRCSAQQDRYVLGYEPTLDPGETIPDKVLDVQLTNEATVVPFNAFDAYGSGLVVHRSDGVQYFGYNGSTSGVITIPEISRFGGNPDVSAEGRSFATIKASPGSSSWCPPHATDIIAHIAAYEASGSQWESPLSLPACTQVHSLSPTPDGGVIALALVSDGVVNEYRLIALALNGGLKWMEAIAPKPNGKPDIQVTLNGDVAMLSRVVQGNTSTVHISLKSGLTGESLYARQFRATTGSHVGYAPSANDHTFAINSGRLYTTLSKCRYDWWTCSYENTLYALDIPGMEVDYPRGAILQAGEPEQNLVLLGDSFSSGQGVRGYIPGTEASGPPGNTCHQSKGAYGHLLDTSPVSRLRLTAFKACGGATTTDVVNGRVTSGWVEKPEQLSALSQNTDIVAISIGGNDVGYEKFALECVKPIPGAHCDGIPEKEMIDKIKNMLPAGLTVLFNKISDKISEQARVLVIGYPVMIEDITYTAPNCSYLTLSEKAAIQRVITALNQALQDAVDRKGMQFEFVNTNSGTSPFKNHGLCYDGSFFHGVVVTDIDSTFHPKTKGHEAYRRIIEEYLAINT